MFRLVLAAAAVLLAVPPAFAQQRPLVTEDPEPVGAGRLLLESGIDLLHGQRFPVSGLEGNMLRLPTLGVSVGTISRWENEAREVDARSWVLVALLAVESLGGERVVERVFSGIVRAKSEPPPTFVSVRHDEGTTFDEARK